MTECVEICIPDPRLPHAALEQVLIGPGLIGLAVLLTEHVALLIVAGVFSSDGVLDLFVILQVLKKLIQKIHRPPGVVRLGGGYRLDGGGGRDGIVVVGKPVSRLTDLEGSLLHIDVLPAQAAQLPQPQAGEQIKNNAKRGRLRSLPRRSDQPVLFFPAQNAHFALYIFRKFHAFYRIPLYQFILNRLFQSQMQEVSYIGQRLGGQSARPLDVSVLPALVEEVLQSER